MKLFQNHLLALLKKPIILHRPSRGLQKGLAGGLEKGLQGGLEKGEPSL